MARLWTNSIRGELSSGITDTDTTLDAAIFAELPIVSSPDTLRLTLDPNRKEGLGKPEIVEITDHSSGSTTVTVARAVETGNNGGSAQSWPAEAEVVHAWTADDADQHEHNTVVSSSQSSAYILSLSDAGTVVEATSGLTFTVPTDASVAFDIGTIIEVFSDTTSTVSVAPDTGVTLVSPDNVTGSRDLSGRYAGATLRKRDTDIWAIHGSLL